MTRAQKTAIGEWWWTVDRSLLLAFLVLIGSGVVMSFAASPGAAVREGLAPFHFVERHLIFVLPTIAVLIATSFLSPRDARRFCIIALVIVLAATAATLVIGVENKGSRRWLRLAGLSVQPSEFLKPAFVVVTAWLLSGGQTRPGVPGNFLAILLLAPVVAVLVLQPDIGQTILVIAVWGAMFFVASMPWIWVCLLGAAGAGSTVAAYLVFPHVASRIDRFLHGQGDNFQLEMAMQSITRGGWFGVGPGEGTVKRSIPDSHTDFIFAVIGEEFGIALCIAVAVLFAFVVVRGLTHALRAQDPFCRLAVTGLVALFGFQSAINMGVSLQLMPAKGMTLPFISYGGSSMVAVAFGMGLLLAFSRKRPRASEAALLQRSVPAAPLPAAA
jgi:cell division protein FtsW